MNNDSLISYEEFQEFFTPLIKHKEQIKIDNNYEFDNLKENLLNKYNNYNENNFKEKYDNDIVNYEKSGIYNFKKKQYNNRNLNNILDEDDKKAIAMETFSFCMELTEDNRLLIEFYPPGDMGARLNSNEMEESDVYVKKEEAIQLGTSDVYVWGYCHSFSYLHTGEILFQMLIDEEVSQEFIVYETPWGWTFEPVYFEDSDI